MKRKKSEFWVEIGKMRKCFGGDEIFENLWEKWKSSKSGDECAVRNAQIYEIFTSFKFPLARTKIEIFLRECWNKLFN